VALGNDRADISLKGNISRLRQTAVMRERIAEIAAIDLVEAGIIDPTKVLRIALENAVSVASVLLLTEATMTEIFEATKERPATPEMPY
ncbi:MAG: hypothetical protein WB820_07040, partial [Rhodoplanes sp.]